MHQPFEAALATREVKTPAMFVGCVEVLQGPAQSAASWSLGMSASICLCVLLRLTWAFLS